MRNIFDNSDKQTIAGPITLNGDDPVTKYRAKSDGRLFWAYNGAEVFYEGERLYAALDEIELLQSINTELQYALGLLSIKKPNTND